MSNDYQSENAPRERSTYSAFGDEYRGFDARDEESGGKGPLIVALAVGVVLVFGTVVWNAYRQGVKTDISDTPIYAADNAPFKRRPEDTGGVKTPNTDKRLFDSIDNRTRTEAEIAELSASEPKLEEVAAKSDGVPRDIRPATTPEKAKEAEPTPKTQVAPQPIIEAAPEPVVEDVVVSQPRPLPPVASSPTTGFDQSGQFLVQIMALKDQASAEQAWSRLVDANRDLFQGATLDVQRADLGAKGIFFRVRASAFASRPDAEAFCGQLKASGQNCIVTTRS